ncbi:type I site-specific deoxyribonuclease [Candidatus Electrothrix aarhusensis]
MTDQQPEQSARATIDIMLAQAGWAVQSKKEVNLSAAEGVAVREYWTDTGPADYVLFVQRKPVGVIEAKRVEEGERLTTHEDQAEYYAAATLQYKLNKEPLPFIYESTGILTRFTDRRDPKPRSRPVFHFHQPKILLEWLGQKESLRARLQHLPGLSQEGLRPAQLIAIENLEKSFQENRPKALIQMATGAGKTFTACTFVYRLLKHAEAKRILFLVDTRNLGEQAEQEFLKYQPVDDNRKFTELYNVQRLSSGYIASDAQVCISTIQRLYSILQGQELAEDLEQENPNEQCWQGRKKEPMPVAYSARNPIEQFDFIIIDECHRSIYNLWKQVLEYYDAFLIGLTATPDKRTFGFFHENVVSEYTYEASIIDGVNVPYDVFTIETAISRDGATIQAQEYIERRGKLTRSERWQHLDEEYRYSPTKLDKDVVNPSQIRTIIRAFRDSLPTIFPDRFDEQGVFEVPKTLVFAKTDSHADDIIQAIREEFSEGNEFCKKITYTISEDPKSVLNRFRNSWAPRIAVTVDMIATGTDVKPLEVLLFLRDVKSSNYFEQMKGRGTRTVNFDDLKKVTRTAKHTKSHFVLIDAVGAVKSKKTDSRPLERKPGVPLKDLLAAAAMGAQDEDLFTSLANRLIRLDKKLTDREKERFTELSQGKNLNSIARDLLASYDPDIIETIRTEVREADPLVDSSADPVVDPAAQDRAVDQQLEQLRSQAASVFTGELNQYLENVRKIHEQLIDTVNMDTLLKAERDSYSTEKAEEVVRDFSEYIAAHKDEITALAIFYDQPFRRRDLTFAMIKEVLEKLQLERPLLAPHYVWDAYAQLEEVKERSPKEALVALVSLIRRVTGIDQQLTPYNKTVDKNFQDWVFGKQAGALKFTEEQMDWLRMLKDHICSSFHVAMDDLDFTPFDAQGGRGKMYQLFGDGMGDILDELNERLAA